jgi:hypothetical protein
MVFLECGIPCISCISCVSCMSCISCILCEVYVSRVCLRFINIIPFYLSERLRLSCAPVRRFETPGLLSELLLAWSPPTFQSAEVSKLKYLVKIFTRLLYWSARLLWLVESITWNQFLGSLKVKKVGRFSNFYKVQESTVFKEK